MHISADPFQASRRLPVTDGVLLLPCAAVCIGLGKARPPAAPGKGKPALLELAFRAGEMRSQSVACPC
jgi:hypothetical protein